MEMQDEGSQDLLSKYNIIHSKVYTKLLGFLNMWLISIRQPDMDPKTSY